MEPRADALPNVVGDRLVALDPRPREVLAGVPVGQRRLRPDLAGEADGAQHRRHVVRVGEVAGVDQQRVVRARPGQTDDAAALRPGDAGDDRVARAAVAALRREVRLLGVGDLDVARLAGGRAGEGAPLGTVGVEGRHRPGRVVDDADQQVVDQPLPHRQVDHRPHPDLLEVRHRPDPRAQQQPRRLEHPGTEDRLPRPDRLDRPARAADPDAGHPPVPERQPDDVGPGAHRQVRLPAHRLDEGAVAVDPLPVADRRAVPAGAVEDAAVEVGVLPEARLRPGGDHRRRQRVVGRQVRRPQPRLQRLEGGPDVVPAPAGAAEGGPAVVVGARAAQPDHPVQAAGAAEHPAARHGVGAARGAGLGNGAVGPVDVAPPEREVGARGADRGAVVRPAGLQQEDAAGGVGREPVREGAAGRARADDHDVVGRGHRGQAPSPGAKCQISLTSVESTTPSGR